MNKVMETLSLLVIIVLIGAFVLQMVINTFEIPGWFYIIASLLLLFTVGFRYYFENNKKVWGLILMVLTNVGIVIGIIGSLTIKL